ncbi:SOH1-domain-containing protein [Lipomyces arxii]|uniref:SOH1-domain-containing protein n=1 Tax=Lipomyces arxii TaxID=56418 RepID=UPI0034CF8E2F
MQNQSTVEQDPTLAFQPPSDGSDQQVETIPSRFEVELEFVQCLANPQYVNFLAQNNYFEDEHFIKYLEYLEYWRKPEFVKYLVYPNCLHVLTLLRQPLFRQQVRHADVAQLLMDDMYAKWLRVGNYQIVEKEDSLSAGEEDVTQETNGIAQQNGYVKTENGTEKCAEENGMTF